jgi:hypothetical protein
MPEAPKDESAAKAAWLVVGTDDLLALIKTAAESCDAYVTKAAPDAPLPSNPGKVVVVEWTGAESAEVIAKASATGSSCVAIVAEPTLESVTKAIRAGARDVIAGRPEGGWLAARSERWTAPRPAR